MNGRYSTPRQDPVPRREPVPRWDAGSERGTPRVPAQHPRSGDDDFISRVILVTQLPPRTTPEIIKAAFDQFVGVRKVVLRKDPLKPKANLITWAGASALLELESAQGARQVVQETREKLLMVGVGPRSAQAHHATMDMLAAKDWPEAFVPCAANNGRRVPRRRLKLIDATDAKPMPVGPQQKGGSVVAGPSEWKSLKATQERQREEVKAFAQATSSLHKELHRRQHNELREDLQKIDLGKHSLDRRGGSVAKLWGYYYRNPYYPNN